MTQKNFGKKSGKNPEEEEEEEERGGEPHEAGIAPPERVSTRSWRSRI